MSQQQAQIDALEHLVVALYRELETRNGLPLAPVIKAAKASVMGSDGPPGTTEKSAASEYLDHLSAILSKGRTRT